MNLVEAEILGKLAGAIGSGFNSYYQGEVKIPARPMLPALILFGEETEIISQGTLKDRYRMGITIRAVVDLMNFVKDDGNIFAHNLVFSSSTGTFVAGENISGQTSNIITTVTTGGTAFLVVGTWGSTQTMVVGEQVVGASSGATGIVSSILNRSMVDAQYQLRELMEGRDPNTNMLLPNSVLGVLRHKDNLRGQYYYFSDNTKISYHVIQNAEFFYVAAEMHIEAETDLIQRPGY